MVCVIFEENPSLPETNTKVLKTIFDLIIARSLVRTESVKDPQAIQDALYALGELSWRALQQDEKQLLLRKVGLLTSFPINEVFSTNKCR